MGALVRSRSIRSGLTGVFVLTAAASLAACDTGAMTPGFGDPGDPGDGSACSVDPAAFVMDEMYSDTLGQEALDASGANTLRVVRPGEAMTMDFRPERLTLMLDDDDRVEDIRCG